ARLKPVLFACALATSAAGGVVAVTVREPERIPPRDPPAMVSQRAELTVRERLQGGWRIVKAEQNGESVLDPGFIGLRFVFTSDRFIYRTDDRDQDGKYRLDAAASPATLTLTFGKSALMDCIFEVTDRRLKACWRKQGPRPVTFDTTQEPEAVPFVFEKQ